LDEELTPRDEDKVGGDDQKGTKFWKNPLDMAPVMTWVAISALIMK